MPHRRRHSCLHTARTRKAAPQDYGDDPPGSHVPRTSAAVRGTWPYAPDLRSNRIPTGRRDVARPASPIQANADARIPSGSRSTPRPNHQPDLHANQQKGQPLFDANRAQGGHHRGCRPPSRIPEEQKNRSCRNETPETRENPEVKRGCRLQFRRRCGTAGGSCGPGRRFGIAGIGLNWSVVSQKVIHL